MTLSIHLDANVPRIETIDNERTQYVNKIKLETNFPMLLGTLYVRSLTIIQTSFWRRNRQNIGQSFYLVFHQTESCFQKNN